MRQNCNGSVQRQNLFLADNKSWRTFPEHVKILTAPVDNNHIIKRKITA